MLSPEDHAIRATGIGGSDVGAVVGLSPFKRPIDVYNEKIGDAPDVKENDAMYWGNELEPIVAERYRRDHEIRPACYVSPKTRAIVGRKWQIVSADRLVLTSPGKLETAERIVEIKTAGKWGALGFGDDGTDDLPPYYICQVAWYMSGFDVDRADVPSLLTTNDYRVFVQSRDLELEGYLLEEAHKFWHKYVLPREPPPPDGSKNFSKYVSSRFKSHSDIVRPSSTAVDQIAAELRSVTCLRKAAQGKEEELKQHIANAIGDDKAIETADGKISYTVKRGRVNQSAVAAKLAEMAGIGARALKSLQEDNRLNSYRSFYMPRAWQKDELADPHELANPKGIENVRELKPTTGSKSGD